VYGAGNIGRGFIGMLLSLSGYVVTFVDVDENIVSLLNTKGRYTVRTLEGDTFEDTEVFNVRAINGRDTEAVASAIAETDILATSVGANVLPHIVPVISKGIQMRPKITSSPLNILICENLMDANHILKDLLCKELNLDDCSLLDEHVGFVETSIGRMIPVQTPEMREGDPLRICSERYCFLPVDKDAFLGEIPHIERMIPFSPFDFYLKRKLYLHNMAHALCAYLGSYTGATYIWEAMDNPSIRLIVKEAMCESMAALSKEYGVPMQDILPHADDLLIRFTNKALGDTCARVGGDAARKLKPKDRLIGALNLCLKHNIFPSYIAIGAAGALYRYLSEAELRQTDEENIPLIFSELSEISANSEFGKIISDLYTMYSRGNTPWELHKAAEFIKKSTIIDIV